MSELVNQIKPITYGKTCLI